MKRNILLAAIVLFVLAQLVPVSRTNPPPQGVVDAPPAVKAILERSCYDCHSRETRWPWYAHVAPASWLVAYDVHHARKHLDFTAWDTYTPKRRAKKIGAAWDEVHEGDMPLFYYLPLHPKARLSDADKQLIHEWARSAGADTDSHADAD